MYVILRHRRVKNSMCMCVHYIMYVYYITSPSSKKQKKNSMSGTEITSPWLFFAHFILKIHVMKCFFFKKKTKKMNMK